MITARPNAFFWWRHNDRWFAAEDRLFFYFYCQTNHSATYVKRRPRMYYNHLYLLCPPRLREFSHCPVQLSVLYTYTIANCFRHSDMGNFVDKKIRRKECQPTKTVRRGVSQFCTVLPETGIHCKNHSQQCLKHDPFVAKSTKTVRNLQRKNA